MNPVDIFSKICCPAGAIVQNGVCYCKESESILFPYACAVICDDFIIGLPPAHGGCQCKNGYAGSLCNLKPCYIYSTQSPGVALYCKIKSQLIDCSNEQNLQENATEAYQPCHCLNNGTRLFQDGLYSCLCPDYYSGDLCQTKIENSLDTQESKDPVTANTFLAVIALSLFLVGLAFCLVRRRRRQKRRRAQRALDFHSHAKERNSELGMKLTGTIMYIQALFALFCIFECTSGLGIDCTRATCKLDDDSVRFVVLGDWGGDKKPPYTTAGQRECANLISSLGNQRKPQFFISTGDNFYEYGVKNAEDPRFKITFDDVFLYGKDTKIPWYITQGNHDWYGNSTAQIAYSKLNDRWVCPDLSFSASYDAHPKGPTVDMVFLDTILLCGNTWNSTADDDDPDEPDDGAPEGHKIKDYLGPADPAAAESMWSRVEQQMANSKADYLLVVGHYPAFAADRHGISDCLVPRLQDLLDKYNGNAYFCGHAHNMQHTTTTSKHGRIIHHVLSGAGHLTMANYKNTLGKLKHNPWQVENQFFFPQKVKGVPKEQKTMGGLTYAELGKKSGRIEYYNCDGTHLYGFDIVARTTN